MPFTEKVWEDAPSTDTPLSAAAITDMETRLSDYTDSASTAKADLPINVKDYGAVGNGVVDDTAELQAAIDACYDLPASDPAVTGRFAIQEIYLPPGVYIVSAPLVVRSMTGLVVRGSGQLTSEIRLKAGTNVGTILDLDGIAFCSFEDFAVTGDGATATCDRGITVRWSTGAARSTTRDSFRNILVGNLKYKTGIYVEPDDGGRQNDEIWMENVTVSGSWTAGEATWWQTGFRLSNGTPGNTFDVQQMKCNASFNSVGTWWSGSGGLYTGSCQGNGTDFKATAHRTVEIGPVRSESAERLLEVPGASGVAYSIYLHSVYWENTNLHADNYFIKFKAAGMLSIQNLFVDGTADPTNDPLIEVDNASLSGGIVSADGMVCSTAPGSLFVNASAWVGGAAGLAHRMTNYVQLNFTTQVATAVFPGNALTRTVPSVTAAATIDLPREGEVVLITGNTNITSITATGQAGRSVVLIFSGTPTLTDGSNLKLSGNFVATADDAVHLVCDGTNWYQPAPGSAN